MNEFVSRASMTGSNLPLRGDRQLFEALPDVAEEYKSRFGVKQFIKGLTGGIDPQNGRGLHANLYDLRINVRVPGSWIENCSPGARLRQSRFQIVPDHISADTSKSCALDLDAEGFQPTYRSPISAAIRPRGPILMNLLSNWLQRPLKRCLRCRCNWFRWWEARDPAIHLYMT